MNKKLFSINTTNRENHVTDEEPLVTKRASEELQEMIFKYHKVREDFVKQYRPMMIVRGVIYFLALIFFIIIVNHIKSWGSLRESYHEAFYLYIIFTILVIAVFFSEMISKSKLKEFQSSNEYREIEKLQENTMRLSKDEFMIPEDSEDLTVLAFRYEIAQDKMILLPKNSKLYMPLAYNIFVKSNVLHLASIDQLVELDLSDFVEIQRMNEKVFLVQWIENGSYRKEPYKKYKIRKTRYEQYTIKPYYIITFKINEIKYDLTLPVYEIAKFVRLTGIEYADEYTSME